ncbi:MAG: hypothetical protein RIS45_987 [Planctomycetota bacterium]
MSAQRIGNAIVCTFIDATGSATVRGKKWRWEFHHFLGPTFVRANGEPLTKQPGERHPVWEAFYDWYEAKFGPIKWREEERATKAAIAAGTLTRKS